MTSSHLLISYHRTVQPQEYCELYLTHETLNARKDHNKGWKHLMNVKNYYARLIDEGVSMWEASERKALCRVLR